jgi:hypothetical protein
MQAEKTADLYLHLILVPDRNKCVKTSNSEDPQPLIDSSRCCAGMAEVSHLVSLTIKGLLDAGDTYFVLHIKRAGASDSSIDQ